MRKYADVLWDELKRSDRKTLSITVRPDRTILVRSPLGASDEEIFCRVDRRRAWIKRQLDYFEQFEPRVSPRQYVSGETHLYRGRRYRLKIIQDVYSGVSLRSGYIEVRAPDTEPRQVQSLLTAWYRERAEAVFPKVFEGVVARIGRQTHAQPRLLIQQLPRRWGTCHQDGRIVLNVDLIRAPRNCLEYVVAHELCHLTIPNHSARFRILLGNVMPDWHDRRAQLEIIMARS